MATFDELVKQIDDNLETQRDRGTAFEHMVVSYLKNEPTYKQKFKNVWMLSDVPAKYNISHQDTGVDIVAEDYNGNLTAVQAKFYTGKVSKDSINSFIAEASKAYYTEGILVSSTDEWNRNAESALENNSKPITRIGLAQLRSADFDWTKFDFKSDNTDLSNKKSKKLRDYQALAIKKSVEYFKTHTRGKLIMAPGTGKTFTSLKIMEAIMRDQAEKHFNVLYLVPSIQLLSQTLFNWNSDVSDDLHMTSFSVVSDRKATKKKSGDDDLSAKDIGFPATTNVEELMDNYRSLKFSDAQREVTVVFSTYQSIEVLHKAQEQGYPEFDLIIADEAHRTTGAARLGEESAFTLVHSDTNVKGKLRLYQTATPKIYDQNAKKKAQENSIVVSSMDDEAKYGQEIFRLGFGDAVAQGYLTDYKVSVLAVDESYINKDLQDIMTDDDSQLKTSDIGKIVGVWNAMVRRNGITGEITGAPLKRAIAFTDTIKHSKVIAKEFETVVNEYLDAQSVGSFKVDVHHVDGGLNALQKKTEIDWLADSDIEDNRARILSNVRFLTEGIDVPNLDGIIFFSPKKSQVDIVQAVGRIMRRYEGKEYGYIILPIVVSTGTDAAAALDNNVKYKEVWQVLNALRSVDERFEAEINKLDLNKKKSDKINLIGVNSKPDGEISEDDTRGKFDEQDNKPRQLELPLEFKDFQNAFYGKIVQKVGDRRYLEDWSKNVADIAKQYIQRINDLIDSNAGAKLDFDKFLTSLRHNINDGIDKDKAIEMLAQHLITEPVFDALFGEYSFAKNNVVSKSMNDVVSAFNVFGFNKDQDELKPFYESIKLRASGIDNALGKQKLIVTLYDKFFRTGFKETTEQLGIVFTPVEVVDFIVRSVDVALQKYFGKRLASKDVHILDPFTGTGTFITRTLEYLKEQMDRGEITFDDILRKYTQELHANEIVLLSYYIAAINIESVFDEVNGPEMGYQPFEGIVLTDTFESTERENSFMDELLGQNNSRLKKQQANSITAIIGNPPYSVGQKSENDNNKNTVYPKLNQRISETYVSKSNAGLTGGLYDSYIKAIRWASDRLNGKGIIGFITNNGYLTSNSADGLRAGLYEEFNYLYIFDLKGAIRGKIGDKVKREGQNIFDILTGVSIAILVKDGSDNHELFYHNIGNYLSRKEKIKELFDLKSIENITWDKITPDGYNDWLEQRDPNYEKYLPITLKGSTNTPFKNHAMGVKTNRDSWVSGFSKQEVLKNSKKLIDNYHAELRSNIQRDISKINNDPRIIDWSTGLKTKFKKGQKLIFKPQCMTYEMYRPFTKKWLMYDNELVERPGKYYTQWGTNNMAIVTSGRGSGRGFSCFVTTELPDIQLMMNCQGFMRYDNSDTSNELLAKSNDNINQAFADKLGLSLDDTFAYVYGLLNSSEYQEKYANDLKKDLARIPVVKNKNKYVEVGKKLMDLHLNYEDVAPYDDVDVICGDNPSYRVKKMKFGKGKDKSTIIFNDDITIKNIPDKAYEYIVNGRSAIEWIMDQYQIKTNNKSGIVDDPNDFSNDPKYIFNLLLRIINVSVQTVDLINQLPKFEVIESD